MQSGFIWARNMDGSYEHSVTVQVQNKDILVDTILTRNWVDGKHHHAGVTQVSQIISDSGVEDFLIFGKLNSRSTLYRKNVTSVTFHIYVFQAYVQARWIIYFWEESGNIIKEQPFYSIPTQRFLIYDKRNGQVIRVQDYIGVNPKSKLTVIEMEKQAIALVKNQIAKEHVAIKEVTSGLDETNIVYRININMDEVIITPLEQNPKYLKESYSDKDTSNLKDLKHNITTWKWISIIALIFGVLGLTIVLLSLNF